MQNPSQISQLSVAGENAAPGPYPMLGFVPVWDAELGNGDYFGLYWPFGREDREPVVCDMLHDEWAMELSFSSVDKFLHWLKVNDWKRGEHEIDDHDFAPAYYAQAQMSLGKGLVDEAISYLQKAVDSFPEDCRYWMSLSSQLRRVGRIEESAAAISNAFTSNWCFGIPNQAVERAIKTPVIQEILPNDPIIKRAPELNLSFGGSKENANYALIIECVTEYFEQNEPIKALMLYHNYAFMMYSETTSFQERNGFDLKKWREEFSEFCQDKLGNNRCYQA